MTARKPYIGGNWKMNTRQADAVALAEAIAETRRVTTSAVRDVHVEILRQMHEMREAQTEMFREVREAQKELAAEVAALRMAQREFVRR